MVKGMEILKQTDIMENVYPDFAKGIVVAILVIGLFASVVWACYEEDFGNFAAGFVVTILATAGAYLIFGIAAKSTPSGKHEYEVIFDDTVDMKDVYARYEIVETRGNIYVLRDLEPVEEKCNCHNAHTCKKKAEREDTSKVENNDLNTDEVEDNNIPNYCSNCGESFASTDKFCSECGTKR